MLALVAACSGGERCRCLTCQRCSWRSSESAVYVLKSKTKGEVVGHTTLSVVAFGNNVEMSQNFANDSATDVRPWSRTPRR